MKNLVVLNKDNFEEILNKNEYVIVDFWADWCMPCKMMSPIFEKVSEKYKGKVLFGKLNVDENPEIASKYNIMSIPTLILFKNGEKLAEFVGLMPENIFEEKINSFLK